MAKKPVGVPIRVANCASVSVGPNRARSIFRASLTTPGFFGVPWIILGCEAADFKAEDEAKKFGWEARQFTDTSATAGSVVAWDPAHVVQLSRARLVEGTPAGEGIQARSLVQVKLGITDLDVFEWFAAGHAPPDRADRGQAAFLAKIRRYQGVVAGDFNERPDELGPLFRREYVGHELLGALIPKRIPVSLPRPIAIGSDHKAVDINLWHPTKETS